MTFYLFFISVFLVMLSGIIPPNPFFVRIGDVWYTQFMVLLFVLFTCLSVRLWKFNKVLSVFSLTCLFSALFTAGQHPRALFCLMVVYFSCLAIEQVSNLKQDEKEKLLKAIVILVFIQGAWVIVQSFNLDPIFHKVGTIDKSDTVGFSGSHNQLGLFFAVTAPLVATYFIMLLPLTIFGLFCATTTSAWIGFAVGMIFILAVRSKKFVIPFILIFGICTYIFYTRFEEVTDTAFKERIKLWQHSVKVVNDGKVLMKMGALNQVVTCNPLFGFGIGNFIRISPYSQEAAGVVKPVLGPQHRYEHAHNDYVENHFEMGWTGDIMLFLVLLDILIKFVRSQKTKLLVISFSCILAQMVTALGIYTVQTAVSGLLLIIFLGIFYGEAKPKIFQNISY